MSKRPSGYHDVVKAYWRQTKGYVLASRQPCIRIRDDEVKHINRVLVAQHPDDLASLELPKSWIMAVLLCPGDSTADLAAWARKHRIQPGRVWFFLHPDTDPEALRPWRDVGFRTDQVAFTSTWEDLHPLFGLALNDQVYADFRPELT